MTFEIPDEFFTVAAAGKNAQDTRKALEAQSAEMRRLLQQGKDIPCPYCAQLIAKDAYVCSQCQGVLSIGSWEAIRLAIHLEPTLAYRDAETIERLSVGVREIDEYWAEQAAELAESQRLSEQQRVDDENQRRRQAEIAREESIRASEEARKVAAAEEHARIEALDPLRRWFALHKPLVTGVTGCLMVAVALFGIMSTNQANQVKELTLQAKEVKAIKKSCSALVPELTARVSKLKQNKISYFKFVKPNYPDGTHGFNHFGYRDYSTEKSVGAILTSLDAQRNQSLKVLRTSALHHRYSLVTNSKHLGVLSAYRSAISNTKNSAWVGKEFKSILKDPENNNMSAWALEYTDGFFTSMTGLQTKPSQKVSGNWDSGLGGFPTYLGLESSWTDLIKSCKAIR